jgi:phosphohistidine phosphatase
MEIYLMQHGPNLSKDQDPEEPLSHEGEAQISVAAGAAKKMDLQFDAVIASTKKRSRQTAEIMAEALGFPTDQLIETEKVKAMTPPEETVDFLRQFENSKSIFIAGHLPSLAKLASYFLTGDESASIHFLKGGLCRIDLEGFPNEGGELRWYLTPDQLNLIAES